MWEDNNPLSFDRRSSTSSFRSPSLDRESDNEPPDFLTKPPRTPPETSGDEAGSRHGDEDEDEEEQYRQQRREQGYNSRVEQTLLEYRDLPIVITDAGKNSEGSGGFIVYTIKTGELEVRRRYSEFESLRKNLSLLHPCLIVPPIPEKHQVSDYVAAPTSAKENVNIIDHRKRMLGVFLNRCARMREIREDSVFQRFLDPNASWSEVLHSPPISNLPKQHLKAPPLNPSNPSPAHQFLPLPSASSKLKNTSISPPSSSYDPYFKGYESSTRVYENLLTGSIERVNRRILKRLSELSIDYHELGARYNAFSLSETGDLASAIEKIGQAVDSSYIATEELALVLGSGFAEPLRESAQFAGVVQKVLRYRVLKRVQEEMTKDLLQQKRTLLQGLERSEMEARRIEQYLHGGSGFEGSSGGSVEPSARADDVESIDSGDFPPTHSDTSPPQRSKSISQRSGSSSSRDGGESQKHRKSQSYSSPPTTTTSGSSGGGFLAKGFGKLNYAIHGIVDVDPERTRRDNIGKTREQLQHLEMAIEAAEKDVKDASKGVLKDLRRFQKGKEEDLKKMMIVYAKCHIEWAKKNLEGWEEAKEEVEKIQVK
ncbi:PX-domain-containing protein [Choiromyces venosus 120613-1]|uniref:PX-domain-containing protein n=1 Tax=Choiromyces venosus 120613-1 TaxID=1336337 RepID=A0A3N4JYY3_9PEZI|nr:PX-domain-containing protein [Choiromyces venosus 120613-1]